MWIEIPELNSESGLQTVILEYRRGDWNSACRGEICRYAEEYRWRRRVSGL